MAFPESVKLEAKRLANFKCVVCQGAWVEVHHIEPQVEGGADTLDNAAPLCGSCHLKFGDNPRLRKQLREMRDHWWERCREQAERVAPIASKLAQLRDDHRRGREEDRELLNEVKALVLGQLQETEQRLSSASTTSQVLEASSDISVIQPSTGPGEEYAFCVSCSLSVPGEYATCPYCGGPIA